uniref:Putative secreted protein n=1 Tax=Ixodes ricinus TaxID=34613 RepID=A0A6B0UUZ2_IXORI
MNSGSSFSSSSLSALAAMSASLSSVSMAAPSACPSEFRHPRCEQKGCDSNGVAEQMSPLSGCSRATTSLVMCLLSEIQRDHSLYENTPRYLSRSPVRLARMRSSSSAEMGAEDMSSAALSHFLTSSSPCVKWWKKPVRGAELPLRPTAL